MPDDKKYIPVKFRAQKWQEIREVADQLATERSVPISMPDLISEAVNFFKENRQRNG